MRSTSAGRDAEMSYYFSTIMAISMFHRCPPKYLCPCGRFQAVSLSCSRLYATAMRRNSSAVKLVNEQCRPVSKRRVTMSAAAATRIVLRLIELPGASALVYADNARRRPRPAHEGCPRNALPAASENKAALEAKILSPSRNTAVLSS